jgi:SagB-type dehydrogenase family enzyme
MTPSIRGRCCLVFLFQVPSLTDIAIETSFSLLSHVISMTGKRRVGKDFQEETKYDRDDMDSRSLDWSKKPAVFHHFTDVESFKLPPPKERAGPSLWTAMGTRRSRRNFAPVPLKQEELSQLAWAASGVTAKAQGLPLRTAPSAGGLYPIETYVVINRVHGLESGVYHYFPPTHSIEMLRRGDYSRAIAHAALDQKMAANAPVVFLWTAVVERCAWKYRQRAYRYIYMDAGHIGQNVALAAEGLGLGCCAIGAIYDDEVNELVGADGEDETAVYLTCVGHYKR